MKISEPNLIPSKYQIKLNQCSKVDKFDADEEDKNDNKSDKGFSGISLSNKYASFVPYLMFVFVAVIIVTAASTGNAIGSDLSDNIEHNRQQQQKSRRMVSSSHLHRLREHETISVTGGIKANKGGKADKLFCLNDHDPTDDEKEFCEEDTIIECGTNTFTDEKIVLSHDLLCTDQIESATDDELKALNAAITLTGPNASIDCKGHTIRQIPTGQFAPGCQFVPGPPLELSDSRKEMKMFCRLYYQAGILLLGGATAVNCNIEQFYHGIYIVNGGDLKKAEMSGNTFGVGIEDLTGSIETTVSDVYAHDNAFGIMAPNGPSANALIIKDVTSTFNHLVGIWLSTPDVTLKDCTTSFNGDAGIIVSDMFPVGGRSRVVLDGKISSHHNIHAGINLGNTEVNVKGEVSLYLNRQGLRIISDQGDEHIITVEAQGSFSSCQNSEIDIMHHGNDYLGDGGTTSFVDEGTDGYTCDTSEEEHGAQGGLPSCVPCPFCS